MAAVFAFTAPLRATRMALMASMLPLASLGFTVAVPASTARAAASASIGSDFPF